MVENAVDKLSVGNETGVILVVNMISGDFITSPVSAFSVPTGFVITTARQDFVPDVAIFGYPRPEIKRFVCHFSVLVMQFGKSK